MTARAERIDGVRIREVPSRRGFPLRRRSTPTTDVIVPRLGEWSLPTSAIIDSFDAPLRLPVESDAVAFWLFGYEVYAVTPADATADEVIRLRDARDDRRRASPGARPSV